MVAFVSRMLLSAHFDILSGRPTAPWILLSVLQHCVLLLPLPLPLRLTLHFQVWPVRQLPCIRLVPITFLLYQFSLLLFVACFTAVGNDCQKRNLIGTDRSSAQKAQARSPPPSPAQTSARAPVSPATTTRPRKGRQQPPTQQQKQHQQ
ncbi:unnamed protein product [Polarella glacialis]|uniref:Uncharacterized protein n=1 Tax=Polarella glacialis TaxID=89957 RepID=A0A813KR90_POLGL|nr:unnamed protein product [Polarella glacialis]